MNANKLTIIGLKKLAVISVIRLAVISVLWSMVFIATAQANIILKVVGINPSEDKQKVELKAYLPDEVKPEDIVDSDDLEVLYDTHQGSYYVYGEYEVEPKGIIEKEVEINDIWVIPQEGIDSLRQEAARTAGLLKNTDFKERATFLTADIESKLNEIVQRQSLTGVSPQTHISNYRDNLKLLDSVKADLVSARSLLTKAKSLPSAKVWKVFLIVVSFLGIFALILYAVWQRQVKVIAASSSDAESRGEEVTKPQARGSEKKKGDLKPEDIEKIIEEGDRE